MHEMCLKFEKTGLGDIDAFAGTNSVAIATAGLLRAHG